MIKKAENPDFGNLGIYQKRVFVPQDADLGDVEQVRALYGRLLERKVETRENLEDWILTRSELEAAIDQFSSIIYIRMTCQTDDAQKAEDYKTFIEQVAPVMKEYDHKLNVKYLELLERFPAQESHYDIYSRMIRQDMEIFREENIAVETQVALLSQKYQAVSGAMTVHFQGKECTLQEMAKYLLSPDRNLREAAWKATAERRLKDKESLEDIFNRMVELRHTIARNAGFENYVQYRFKALHRFDYGPEDCKKFHQTAEEVVVPLWREILKKRKEDMGLEVLRPWDLSVDPLSRPALKPFEQCGELVQKCGEIFSRVDTELGQLFQELSSLNLLDPASRKGKAPGGYQSTLSEFRKPFIFMNAVGTDSDVRTLLHESGHAFHSFLCAHESLLDYRHAPMEFCEVASMSMELLGGEFLDVFYPREEDRTRSRIRHLEDVISVLVWVATVDAFQFWIYENPTHTPEERKAAWENILIRFSTDVVDWSGFEDVRAYSWHRQLHIFEVPFYYIEYAIAQLGALQIWFNAKEDWGRGLSLYKKALSFGGSKHLPELFSEAGIRFDFSVQTVRPLIERVFQEWKKIG